MPPKEETETLDVGDQEDEIYQETNYKEVVEKADKLQEDYYNKKSIVKDEDTFPNLPIGTWVTGLSNGEVVNLEIDEQSGDVILHVRLPNDEVQKVYVKDRDCQYTENNEVVRLLEYLDIEEGRIEKLHGKELDLQVHRYALPSNDWEETAWKPYIPRSLDKLGRARFKVDKAFRYLGYEGEFQKKSAAIAFLFVALFWWSIFFAVASTGFLAINAISAPYGLLITIVTILSLLMTIYTPLISRFGKIFWEKYLLKRKVDTALQDE